MNYTIKILELEKKRMEQALRHKDLMARNKTQAMEYLKNISEIKKAITFLRSKSFSMKSRKEFNEDISK